jgi:hypothetical protein
MVRPGTHVHRFVEQTLRAYDGSHDLEHAERVGANARRVFSGPPEDRSVVDVAAFGHDSCDPKYDGRIRLREFERVCRQDGMSEDDAACVRNVVENVSFSRLRKHGPPQIRLTAREMRVWRCVTDADMLEAMGATGMVRTLMFQGHRGCNLDAALCYAENSLLECIHYLEHEGARAEGTTRQRTMIAWIDECKTVSPLRHLSGELMLRGRNGDSFQGAARLLHCAESDRVITVMAQEMAREGRWTIVD